ncbi:hypothetical protein DIPPA_24596 [Diplonema papillatum]|nr:hypothetical protein DIPPA_24596 [Diplonema papillatum]
MAAEPLPDGKPVNAIKTGSIESSPSYTRSTAVNMLSSPTGSQRRSISPRLRGKKLEDMVEETASALRSSIHCSKSVRGSPPSQRPAIPNFLERLEVADCKVSDEVFETIEVKNDRLTETSEELCKSELNAHWKMLRLRNAVSLVPKLLSDNKVLREEILRARSCKPEEVQKSLLQIDALKKEMVREQVLRSEEELAAKERLRHALEALKNGGFPEEDLIQFVSSALDSAIGVVFRTEDERMRLQALLHSTQEDLAAAQSSVAEVRAKMHELQCSTAKATGKYDDFKKEATDAKNHARSHDEELRQLRETISVMSAENTLSKSQTTVLEDALKRAREVTADEVAVLKNAYESVSKGLERDNTELKSLVETLRGDVRCAQQACAELETSRFRNEKELMQARVELEMETHQRAKFESRFTEAKADNENLEDRIIALQKELKAMSVEREHLQQLVAASVESAESTKQLAEKLQEEKKALSEQAMRLQHELTSTNEILVNVTTGAEDNAVRVAALQEELANAIEARQMAASTLEEMGRKASSMEALSKKAIEEAHQQSELLANERDAARSERDVALEERDAAVEESEKRLAESVTCIASIDTVTNENRELKGQVDTMSRSLKEATAALEEQKKKEDDLTQAEETIRKASELLSVAQAAQEQADKDREENKRTTDSITKVCEDFEKKVTAEAERKLAEKDAIVARHKESLEEESQRNDRAENRLSQCLEQLKTVEAKRQREASDSQQQMRALVEHCGDLENKVKQLSNRMHDMKEDGRFAKRNAQSVGWILAGRGALLKDIHKVYAVLRQKEDPASFRQARELVDYILATHLFECERRHLGMPPSEPIPDAQSESPRCPSPRQVWRLFNHSPAARMTDPPTAPEFLEKRLRPDRSAVGIPSPAVFNSPASPIKSLLEYY